MPCVTVVCAFYNRAALVPRTLDSLHGQSWRDFEALVVDDGSRDDTFAALTRHAGGRVRVLQQRNAGFVRTMIDAIAQTDSEFVAVQGSGDVSTPDRLALQAQYLREHPEVVAVGCHSELVSEADGRRSWWRPSVQPDVKAQLRRENPFIHGDVMFRRAAYEAVGGYRPFFTYRQDLDLWLRLADRGRLAVIPRALYRCYRLEDSVSGNARKLVLAKTLRDFALHCDDERSQGRPDPLDALGPAAALLRPRSAALARDLAYAGWRLAARGRSDDARLLIDASLREQPTAGALAARLATRLPGLPALRRQVVALKSRLRGAALALPSR